MGDSLVRSGVSQNGQSPTMYDSPQETVAAFNKGNVAPEMEANTYTPGLQYDESGGLNAPDVTKPNFLQSNKPQVASFQKPSFEEASATGNGLTKKGLLFKMLVGAGTGAAAGWGAWDPGQGFARGAAAADRPRLAFLQQRQQDIENKRNQSNDTLRAQVDQSQIAANNARAKKDSEEKDIYNAGGALFQKQADGTLKLVAGGKPDEATVEGRQQLTAANPVLWPPNDPSTADYIKFGKREPLPKNVSEWQSELDAAGGDAKKALTNSEARRKRIAASGRADAEDKTRLKTDVSDYYGHVTAKGGTDAAIKAVSDRINSGQLTSYQMHVASETLKQLRSEQNSAFR